MVDEIECVLSDVGLWIFEFVDLIFNLLVKYVIVICEEILCCVFKVNFIVMGINLFDVLFELFFLMKWVGFNLIMIMFEVGCDIMLENFGKGFMM